MFKRANIAERLKLDLMPDPPPLDNASMNSGECGAALAAAGHVVRDDGTLTEKYHGPWSLVAQCRDFAAHLTAHAGDHDSITADMTKKLSLEAALDPPLDLMTGAAGDDAIRLPPKQFLSVMLESFHKLSDPDTNIFSAQTIQEALERAYREPSSPFSERWTVCFNLIILVALGADHPISSDDPFVRPILRAAHAIMTKPSSFLSLRLISVQTLALLSLLAYQYHTENLGDSLFTQACILAKAMGLHHGHDPTGFSANEAAERRKVFRSLYMRDRNAAITRGTLLWLPNDNSKSSSSGRPPSDANASDAEPPDVSSALGYDSRYELARLQDRLYRLLCAGLPESSASNRRTSFARLQHRLKVWSQTNKVPSVNPPTTVDGVSLHLSFLGTRMQLNQSHANSQHSGGSAQLLHDARVCCLLLATSCGNQEAKDRDLEDRLTQMLSPPSTPQQPGSSGSQWSSASSSSKPPLSATEAACSDTTPSRSAARPRLSLQRLATSFPPTAIFVLARHILGLDLTGSSSKPQRSASSSTTNSSSPSASSSSSVTPSQNQRTYLRQNEVAEDLACLEAVERCFENASATGNQCLPNYTTKLGRVVKAVIDILRTLLVQGGAITQYKGEYVRSGGAALLTPDSARLVQETTAPPPAVGLPDFGAYDGGDLSMTAGVTNTLRGGTDGHTHPWPPPQEVPAGQSTSATTTTVISPWFESSGAGSLEEAPFDISPFLNQLGMAGGDGMWGSDQHGMQGKSQEASAPAEAVEKQPAQDAGQAGGRRRNKRLRRSMFRDHDESSDYGWVD
ncbi:hypothetical protein BR93DRAFT_975668 [Coniochaeta sp. PMI_546]|nr:hypothetical protein BR93DRAFT_975668 [Coniochaeta sp. PMI_546]